MKNITYFYYCKAFDLPETRIFILQHIISTDEDLGLRPDRQLCNNKYIHVVLV